MSEGSKQFLKERKEALLGMDLAKLRAFQEKWSPSAPTVNDTVLEISLHKARTAAKDLPDDARLASKKWLEERGYEHWMDMN